MSVQAGRDEGHQDVLAARLAEARAKDDIRIGVGRGTDFVGREADFAKLKIGRSGDVEQQVPGAIDGRLEKRAGDCLARGVGRAVFAAASPQADERRPGILHHRPDVGEVDIDQPGRGEQIDDPLDRLDEHAVDDAEGVQHRCVFQDDLAEAVVGNDDQRIHLRSQFLGCILRDPLTLGPFERERLRNDTDRERPLRLGLRRNERCGAGAGSAPEAGRDEQEVRSRHRCCDDVRAVLGRPATDVRVASGSEAPGDRVTDPDPRPGEGVPEGLGVGVASDEVDVQHLFVDHPVDRVAAGAAHADDADGSRLRTANPSDPAGDKRQQPGDNQQSQETDDEQYERRRPTHGPSLSAARMRPRANSYRSQWSLRAVLGVNRDTAADAVLLGSVERRPLRICRRMSREPPT